MLKYYIIATLMVAITSTYPVGRVEEAWNSMTGYHVAYHQPNAGNGCQNMYAKERENSCCNPANAQTKDCRNLSKSGGGFLIIVLVVGFCGCLFLAYAIKVRNDKKKAEADDNFVNPVEQPM